MKNMYRLRRARGMGMVRKLVKLWARQRRRKLHRKPIQRGCALPRRKK